MEIEMKIYRIQKHQEKQIDSPRNTDIDIAIEMRTHNVAVWKHGETETQEDGNLLRLQQEKQVKQCDQYCH